MVPISKKDITRAFGDTWVNETSKKADGEYFLVKRHQKGVLTWLVVNKRHDVLRRVRSHVVLSKILGTEDQFEFVYDEYVKALRKTEGKPVNM